MRKSLISGVVLLVGLVMSSPSFAQFPNHVKGDIILKASAGLPFMDGRKYEKVDGQTFTTSGLPLYMQGSLDYAISNHFDLGIFGGMGSETVEHKTGDALTATINSTYMLGGARIVYHIWGKARWNWDPYAVLGAGMLSETHEVDNFENDAYGVAESRIVYTARVGLNYHFTPTFGLHAEGGYGITYGTLGMHLRF